MPLKHENRLPSKLIPAATAAGIDTPGLDVKKAKAPTPNRLQPSTGVQFAWYPYVVPTSLNSPAAPCRPTDRSVLQDFYVWAVLDSNL